MAGADDLRPLDAAIAEIRILHEAAEQAAEQIGAESEYFTGRGASPLVADVAEALVQRTEAIREDCERLSSLLQRARSAVAASAASAPRTAPQRGAPAVADVAPESAEPLAPTASGRDYPELSYPFEPRDDDPRRYAQPQPAAEPPAGGSSWRFWRRGRGRGQEPPHPGAPPARLPQPDYAAIGVGPVQRTAYQAPARAPVSEGVRLIATQMAVAGASRTEIERRLQRQFGISNADPALDEIFGLGYETRIE